MKPVDPFRAEITVTFNWAERRLTRRQFKTMSGRFRQLNDVIAVEARVDLYGNQTVSVFFNPAIPPQVMLRRMATILRNQVGRHSIEKPEQAESKFQPHAEMSDRIEPNEADGIRMEMC